MVKESSSDSGFGSNFNATSWLSAGSALLLSGFGVSEAHRPPGYFPFTFELIQSENLVPPLHQPLVSAGSYPVGQHQALHLCGQFCGPAGPQDYVP